jgi:hypothetical protein
LLVTSHHNHAVHKLRNENREEREIRVDQLTCWVFGTTRARDGWNATHDSSMLITTLLSPLNLIMPLSWLSAGR